MGRWVRGLRWGIWLALGSLSGCAGKGFWLFHPQSPIARTEWHMTILDVAVMGAVVLASGALVVAFLWRYGRRTQKGQYDPTFTASTIIETLVWGVPLLVVGFLSYVSIKSVFATNPYNPLALRRSGQHAPRGHRGNAGGLREAVARGRGLSGRGYGRPIRVDVITTDWQWVFVYPRQGIATVDTLVVPVHRRINFRLTSATVVNDFFIPELVGEIDVMPGMRTKQAVIASKTGLYHGYSADFSGGGFSWMGFSTRVVTTPHFRRWVAHVQRLPAHLSYARFNKLLRPTINLVEKPRYFSHVQRGLFDHLIEQVMGGKVYPTPLAMTEQMTGPMRVKLVK